MSESTTAEQEAGPKHVLRRNLLGRPREGMESAAAIVARYRSAAGASASA